MESINPYAPTTLTAEASVAQPFRRSKVTSIAVASRTISGIALSGGLFGLGLVLVMFVASGAFELGMLLYAGIAFGFGLVIAGIAGFVTVAHGLSAELLVLRHLQARSAALHRWQFRHAWFPKH